MPRNSALNPANVVFFPILLALLLYHSTATSLVRIWTSPQNPTYSHGLLLLGIAMVLFYKQWSRAVDTIRLQPSAVGLLLAASTSILWFMARLGQVQVVQQLCLPLGIGFLLWGLLGFRNARTLAFPLLLLVFAVPVWDVLPVYLQRGTAHAVTFLLNATGISSVLEGLFILIPAGTFEVAEACSGLRQFIVAVTIASLLAYLNRVSLRMALLYVALAGLIAFLTNILRIYIVVVVGELTDMTHYFVTTEHASLGWGLFGIGMGVFFLITSYCLPSARASGRGSDARTAKASGSPDLRTRRIMTPSVGLFLGVCSIAAGPALAYVYQLDAGGTPELQLAMPEQIADWDVDRSYPGDWHPKVQSADVVREQVYRDTRNARITLYISYYYRQEQGKEAVNENNKVYDGKHWIAVAHRGEKNVSEGMKVDETEIKSRDGKEKIVWRWYYVSGTRTDNDYMAKLLNIWGVLRGDPGIAVIMIATDVDESYEDAADRLKRFLTDGMGMLEHSINGIQRSY